MSLLKWYVYRVYGQSGAQQKYQRKDSESSLDLQRIYLQKMSLPSFTQLSQFFSSIAASASPKENSNLPLSSLIRKMSCKILHNLTLMTSFSWLVLCSVRMSSAHSSSMIQWLKLSYSYKLIFSPTFALSNLLQMAVSFSLIRFVSFFRSSNVRLPCSVFMNSITSLEEISALQMQKGFFMGYFCKKLSTFRRQMQYFLQMRKFSSYHSYPISSNFRLQYTKALMLCRICRWALSLSLQANLSSFLLMFSSLQKAGRFIIEPFLLYRAKLMLISALTLLYLRVTSMLELESFLCFNILLALQTDLPKSGILYFQSSMLCLTFAYQLVTGCIAEGSFWEGHSSGRNTSIMDCSSDFLRGNCGESAPLGQATLLTTFNCQSLEC